MKNSNGLFKLKYGYPKLTHFKVWIHFFKSGKRSRVISEVLYYYYLKKKKKIDS
jgi:hypothetical protein